MTCGEGVNLLYDYVEGALKRPTRMAIERHVGGCPKCRNFVAWYMATPGALREATAATMQAGVSGRLRRALARASKAR